MSTPTPAPDALPGLNPELRALFSAHVHTAVALTPEGSAAEASGARIGGAPALPPKLSWPVWLFRGEELAGWPEWAQQELESYRAKGFVRDLVNESGERAVELPLPFVAQVDLAAVHAVAGEALRGRLPAEGSLVFFADPKTTLGEFEGRPFVASAVLLLAANAPLELATPPAMPEGATLPATPVALTAVRQLPEPAMLDDRLTSGLGASAWRELEAAARATEPASPYHALLPLPSAGEIGGDPESAWVPLLRIDTDPALETHWGDAAWITFALPREGLARGVFRDARAFVFVG